MSEADIPTYIWEQSTVTEKVDVESDDIVTYHCMDMIWGHLREKLPNHSRVALSVLTIPH